MSGGGGSPPPPPPAVYGHSNTSLTPPPPQIAVQSGAKNHKQQNRLIERGRHAEQCRAAHHPQPEQRLWHAAGGKWRGWAIDGKNALRTRWLVLERREHKQWQLKFDAMAPVPPPPLVKATQKYQINTAPTLGQGRRRPGSKREDCMVSWCKKGKFHAQIPPKAELCGFKWANTHNKCVHDSM